MRTPFLGSAGEHGHSANLRATPRRPYRAHAPHRARHTTPKTAIRNPIRRCCCCTPFPPPVCRYRCRYCRARHTNDQRHFDGVKQAEGRPPVASDGLGVATRSLGVHTAAGVFPITFCVRSARLPKPLCFVINLITACLPNYDPRAGGILSQQLAPAVAAVVSTEHTPRRPPPPLPRLPRASRLRPCSFPYSHCVCGESVVPKSEQWMMNEWRGTPSK